MSKWKQKPPLGVQLDFGNPLTNGLVGCWLINENGGSTIYDISGNKNNGSMKNMSLTPSTTSGWGNIINSGSSVSFDGTDDYIDCGKNSILKLTKDLSVYFELFVNSFPAGGSPGAIFTNFGGGYSGFRVLLSSDGSITLAAGKASNGVYEFMQNTSGPLILGSINKVVIVKKGITGLFIINGISRPINNSFTETDMAPALSSQANIIGYNYTNQGYISGSLSDLRIWNRSLSNSEISGLYNNSYAFLQENSRKIWWYPRFPSLPRFKAYRPSPVYIGSSTKGNPTTIKPPIGSQLDFSHPITKNLVGYWLFNEGVGSKRYLDISGNNLHASPAVLPSLWKPGKNGPVIVNNGNSNRLFVSQTTLLQPTKEITVAAWVRPDNLTQVSNLSCIFSNTQICNDANSIKDGYVLYWYQNYGFRFGVNVYTHCSNYTFLTGDSNWHFVVGTYRNGISDIYVDLVKGTPSTSSPAWATGDIAYEAADQVAINNLGTYSGYPWMGATDEIMVWNRALTFSEISTLYSNPYVMIREPRKYWANYNFKPTKLHYYKNSLSLNTTKGNISNIKPQMGCQLELDHPLTKGLSNCWLMNEGSGIIVSDLSGNRNNGTLKNMSFPASSTSGRTSGKNGPTLLFDGTNDYISIPVNPLLGKKNFSIMLSAKMNNLLVGTGSYSQSFLNFYTDGSSNALRVAQDEGVPGSIILSYATGGVGSYFKETVNPIVAGQNFLLIIIYDGTTFTLFFNGIKIPTITRASFGTGTENVIGGRSSTTGNLNGEISDVRVWDRLLSSQEISDLYQNPYGFIRDQHKYWYSSGEVNNAVYGKVQQDTTLLSPEGKYIVFTRGPKSNYYDGQNEIEFSS